MKRNVNSVNIPIIDESILFEDRIAKIEKSVMKFDEIEYFENKKKENELNQDENYTTDIFPKFILSSNIENENNTGTNTGEEKEKSEIIEEEYNNINNKRKNEWNPIKIRLNNDENDYKEIYFGKNPNLNKDLNYYYNNNIQRNDNKNEKISGFTEASRILDHLDNHFVDFSSINNEPIEKSDLRNYKFNNEINNKKSYIHFSFGDNFIINNKNQSENNNSFDNDNNNNDNNIEDINTNLMNNNIKNINRNENIENNFDVNHTQNNNNSYNNITVKNNNNINNFSDININDNIIDNNRDNNYINSKLTSINIFNKNIQSNNKIDNNINNSFNDIKNENLNNNLEINDSKDINLTNNLDFNFDILKKNLIKKNNEINFINNKDNFLDNNKKDIEVNSKEKKENNFIANDINCISNYSTSYTRREQIIANNIQSLDIECKIKYVGESNTIPELKIPISINLSSLIKKSFPLFNNNGNKLGINNENIRIIDIEILIQQIKKKILSINDIENKIVIPKDEDFYFQINGKIYSKLTNTNINLNDVEKRIDENNNLYYFINYNFKLKQYPLLLDDEENDIIYITKPSIKDLLDINKNYNLKKVENFEISNKFGKIIFIDPIDLSGKVVINDIIKICDGEIDLEDPRVDKLKAKIYLRFDFGDKLEGTFLENIKAFLRNKNSTFVKYENQILEYNMNF